MGEGMGFRFRRSIRFASGLRINVGLKSVSISTAVRGLGYTIGSSGQRFTVGLPGTGVYWTKAWPNRATRAQSLRIYLVAIGMIVLFGLFVGTLMLFGH
jgi:hypothetical protein